MKNLKTMVASFLATMTMLLAISGSAFAGSPGQLAGGDNYVVKNLTKQGSYSNSVTASCNDELQYSMQLSNTHFGALNNVILTATLPANGGTSTATATTDLGGLSGTSDTVSVTLPSGATQSLINGTTVLYNGNGGVIKTLPDTIKTGVNIGTLNGSTTEFVNFKVKVTCAPVVSTAECSLIELSMVSDSRKVNVTVKTAVNNATITGYKVDYGDGFVATTKDSSHTYAKDGTYKIVASVQAKYADGSTKWITSDACAKSVTVTTEQPQPIYSCDLLDMTAINTNRTVTINKFNYTAKNGATYKHTVIDWGDGSAKTTTSDVVGQTHSYSKDGSYTVKAVAYFTLSNGSVVSDESTACSKTVKFANEQPPVVTPPVTTPPVLPNTGAGSIAAIFGSVTALATLGYGIVSRRLSRQ